MLEPDLVSLECSEPAQLHLQDCISLYLGQAMAVLQLLAGCRRIGCRTDQGNDRIELVKGQKETEEDVITFFGLAQEITGATLDRLDPEVEKHLQHLAKREQNRLTIHQRQHVGTEVALKWRELEQIVQNHLWVGIPPQLHNDAHAITIAFIADVGDAFELLVVDHLSDPLNQSRFVGLVGQLSDDHGIPIRTPRSFNRLDCGDAAHRD